MDLVGLIVEQFYLKLNVCVCLYLNSYLFQFFCCSLCSALSRRVIKLINRAYRDYTVYILSVAEGGRGYLIREHLRQRGLL